MIEAIKSSDQVNTIFGNYNHLMNSKLIRVLVSQGTGRVFGEFKRDKFAGDLYAQWQSALHAATRSPENGDGELESVDVSNAFAYLLAVKDDAELELLRRAAAINSKFYNSFLKEHIIKIIDEDKVFSSSTCRVHLPSYQHYMSHTHIWLLAM